MKNKFIFEIWEKNKLWKTNAKNQKDLNDLREVIKEKF